MGRTRVAAGMLALLLALASGCGPWGPQGVFAGGPFADETEEAFPANWSFSDAHPLVAIETSGALFRHAVTILCVAADGRLYVMARHAPRKRWVQNLARDPRVRLRVGDALYAGRVVRLADPPEADAVARAFLRKYVGIEAEQARALTGAPAAADDRAEVWTWRIEAPEPAS
ncbi:MAG: hypothetical protein ACREI8_15400 [Myxococcota bacterium]